MATSIPRIVTGREVMILACLVSLLLDPQKHCMAASTGCAQFIYQPSFTA